MGLNILFVLYGLFSPSTHAVETKPSLLLVVESDSLTTSSKRAEWIEMRGGGTSFLIDMLASQSSEPRNLVFAGPDMQMLLSCEEAFQETKVASPIARCTFQISRRSENDYLDWGLPIAAIGPDDIAHYKGPDSVEVAKLKLDSRLKKLDVRIHGIDGTTLAKRFQQPVEFKTEKTSLKLSCSQNENRSDCELSYRRN